MKKRYFKNKTIQALQKPKRKEILIIKLETFFKSLSSMSTISE